MEQPWSGMGFAQWISGPRKPLREGECEERLRAVVRMAEKPLTPEEVLERFRRSLSEEELRWLVFQDCRREVEAVVFSISPVTGMPFYLPCGADELAPTERVTPADIRRWLNNPAEEGRFSPAVRARLAVYADRLEGSGR